MIFNPINLRDELIRERSRQHALINSFHELLQKEADKEEFILQRLRRKGGSNPNESSSFFSDEEKQNIFSLEQIKKICIRYRLRFLESGYFKSAFPYEAITAIKNLENKYQVEIEKFYIIAPSKEFDLENINKDPLLFAQLSDNSYYLVHKWGNDLAWHKRILSWPLQDFKSFFISLWIFCIAFVAIIPTSTMNFVSFSDTITLRIWLTIHVFIGMMGLSLWAGLSYDKSFSSMNWNSKYYNY